MPESSFLIFFWSGPLGVGIFLGFLGLFILLIAKADEISKRTKVMIKEKGLEKK